jgi:hypothetical protein
VTELVIKYDAVEAFVDQLDVPNKLPVNESALIDPLATIILPEGVNVIEFDTNKLPVIVTFCISVLTELAVDANDALVTDDVMK